MTMKPLSFDVQTHGKRRLKNLNYSFRITRRICDKAGADIQRLRDIYDEALTLGFPCDDNFMKLLWNEPGFSFMRGIYIRYFAVLRYSYQIVDNSPQLLLFSSICDRHPGEKLMLVFPNPWGNYALINYPIPPEIKRGLRTWQPIDQNNILNFNNYLQSIEKGGGITVSAEGARAKLKEKPWWQGAGHTRLGI